MNLKQQIIQSNIAQLSTSLSIEEDKSFVRLAHSLFTDISVHSWDETDYVDGGQDKQIDVITVIDDSDEAYVYIMQVKNTESFESNILIQIKNGLNWVFNKSRNDVTSLSNKKFQDQILNYRSVQSAIGPSNIHVRIAYVTNAVGTNVSAECLQELKSINDEYDNETFASFKIELICSVELVNKINSYEKRNRKINTDIKIKYDANTPSLIKYQTQGLTGIICSAPASEIARIVNDDVNGYVFDMNIRKYLGNRGDVNPDILSTCENSESSYLFWFLNNGITIVCDKIDPVTDPDNPHIKLTNMQIVNGCQTSSSLARAAKNGNLQRDTRVLVKIFQTGSTDLIDQIVLTTNNQNKISGRNLRSNDPVQADLEQGFVIYGLHYERKPRQFDAISGANKSNIISNDIVATAYLGSVLKRCSDARARKYKVWDEFYEKIFHGGPIQPYVLSSLIFKLTKISLNREIYTEIENANLRFLAKNGAYHISRIASFLVGCEDKWAELERLNRLISKVMADSFNIDSIVAESFEILCKIVDLKKDLGNELKSSAIDDAITKYLHMNKKKT